MIQEVAEKLRRRAHEYSLNAARAEELGQRADAERFTAIEVLLREFADVVDEVLEEAA